MHAFLRPPGAARRFVAPLRTVMAPIAAALVFAVPATALATPATESDLVEIREGVVSVNATAGYQSARVFRGVTQDSDTATLQLKTSLDTGLLTVEGGAKGFVPLQDSNNGLDEPTEVDIFAKARVNLAELIVAEAGATYYYYPGAEDTGGADPHSFEVFAGLDLPVIIPVLIRAYYDVDLENVTVETKGRWRLAILGDQLKLEINSVAGYVNIGDEDANRNAALAGARSFVGDDLGNLATAEIDDSRVYYGVGAGISSRLTDHVSVGANVNWSGTTGEFSFDGAEDNEVLYGGVSVNVGL